jgi:small multidrug resistance pump
MHYLYLTIAVIAEVIGTSTLKATDEFSRLWPTLLVIISYVTSFYFVTLTLRVIPIGVTYAIWSGLGIVFISLVGFFYYKQALDIPAIFGMALIIAGVVVLQLFSKTIIH